MAKFGVFCSLVWLGLQFTFGSRSVYDWMKWDRFDELNQKLTLLQSDPDRCKSMAKSDQYMPEDTVSQVPRFNTLRSEAWYQNRSSLIHLHNMALNRAFFYSYIFQKFNTSQFDFSFNPDWYYYYMSATADVHASDNFINGSAVFFDFNCSYPNWFSTMGFNTTLPFFGPHAYKVDDYRDPGNWLREPTLTTATVKDFGAVGSMSNYSHPKYKMNPWYDLWLPDISGNEDSLNKFTYSVGIKYSSSTGHFTHEEFQVSVFFGPSSPGQFDQDKALPVLFTRPYFDCGHSDKWVVSATSPVVDFMPRYSKFTHLRRARFVAVVAMSIDFERIDFNACPVSVGNPGPSYLSGTARCHPRKHMCKHTSGKGFRRGGYKCKCRAGYRYPMGLKGPYPGDLLEQATEEEMESGFGCVPIDWRLVIPDVENKHFDQMRISRIKRGVVDDDHYQNCTGQYQTRTISVILKEKKSEANGNAFDRIKRSLFYSKRAQEKMDRLLEYISSITAANCRSRTETELFLHGDVSYGVDKQFEAEARTALRLAHFLSNYLQNVIPGESYGDFRPAQVLHEDQLFGEVIANVMADYKIRSSGIFYDVHAFRNFNSTRTREFFGPYAWRTKEDEFLAHDAAGLKTQYINEEWFQEMKQRWSTNMDGMKKYKMKPFVRYDYSVPRNYKFEFYPIKYRGPSLKHGRWTRPRFKCDGQIDDWVMTFVVPFFGKDQLRRNLQFKGVVTVDVLLSGLDVNQCPQPYHVANAFKNTARCPYPSTTCSPLPRYGLKKGGYKCDCSQGYEYAHLDGRGWIEGTLLEREFQKKQSGLFHRFDVMKCRVAGGAQECISDTLFILLLLFICTIYPAAFTQS